MWMYFYFNLSTRLFFGCLLFRSPFLLRCPSSSCLALHCCRRLSSFLRYRELKRLLVSRPRSLTHSHRTRMLDHPLTHSAFSVYLHTYTRCLPPSLTRFLPHLHIDYARSAHTSLVFGRGSRTGGQGRGL
ncbi:hypothetical protein BV22DRAFT_402862 [Leucogyrophana mollusca]|uniref:Uncharacterized protein n=1 Tax=Leucogyrophana mollusca TaxID=85980 RepID=A0ACB8BJZ3_9AGAM|nr:hypothetical protein BV22DRAFT_402862 [Leucogyrophana mollusca]